MFLISKIPLEKIDLKKGLTALSAGALATFEGVIRNANDGKKVVALEYEVFDALALKEGRKILSEAKKKFKITNAKCIHRSGKLKIGDIAVWIGVASAHREEAFRACKYIIDEIKVRLPIWKKEYYKTGDSGWVNCRAHSPQKEKRSLTEAELYSNQVCLPQVGQSGQRKLKDARVLVVGAGGLGCPALMYLASSGVGTIGICEFDTLEASNLHRQILYSHEDIGKSKAALAARQLKKINPFIKVKIHPQKIDIQNAAQIIKGYGLILDCSDNFKAKYILNDIAVIKKIPLIQASVYQFEGQVKFYQPRQLAASCVRCLWPQIPDACGGVCATAGVLGVVPGLLGTIQAAEAIKFLLGLPCLLSDEILTVDLLTYRFKSIKLKRDPACPVCSRAPKIINLSSENYAPQNNVELDLTSISGEEFKDFELIDVREPSECLANPVTAARCVSIPTSQFDKTKHPFDKRRKYLLFCVKGMRSNRLAKTLRDKGVVNVFSIQNGADGLNRYLKIYAKQKYKIYAQR